MTIAFPGDGSVRKDVVELADDVAARLMRFHRESRFASRGGVITDLDGTAVLERKGLRR